MNRETLTTGNTGTTPVQHTPTPQPSEVLPVELSTLEGQKPSAPVPGIPLPRGTETPAIDVMEQSVGGQGVQKTVAAGGQGAQVGAGLGTSEQVGYLAPSLHTCPSSHLRTPLVSNPSIHPSISLSLA